MPFIYNRKLATGDSPDTGGRKPRPQNGGIDVFKAQGHTVAYKITKKALLQLSQTYNANTTKDLLDALKIEDAKGAGNMLSELEVEGAYEKSTKLGTDAFDHSKEFVKGIKDHRTAARDKKSYTGKARATAHSTAAAKK